MSVEMDSRALSAYLKDMVALHDGPRGFAKALMVTQSSVEQSMQTGRPSHVIMDRLGIMFSSKTGTYVQTSSPTFYRIIETVASSKVAKLEAENEALRQEVADLRDDAREIGRRSMNDGAQGGAERTTPSFGRRSCCSAARSRDGSARSNSATTRSSA